MLRLRARLTLEHKTNKNNPTAISDLRRRCKNAAHSNKDCKNRMCPHCWSNPVDSLYVEERSKNEIQLIANRNVSNPTALINDHQGWGRDKGRTTLTPTIRALKIQIKIALGTVCKTVLVTPLATKVKH